MAEIMTSCPVAMATNLPQQPKAKFTHQVNNYPHTKFELFCFPGFLHKIDLWFNFVLSRGLSSIDLKNVFLFLQFHSKAPVLKQMKLNLVVYQIYS